MTKTSFDIFLTLKNEKSGLESEDIAFKILRRIGSDSQEVVWGPGSDKDDKLGFWRLWIEGPNRIDFQYPEVKQKSIDETGYKSASCDIKNVLPSLSVSQGRQIPLNWEQIKFIFLKEKSCKRKSLKFECDISPSPDTHLRLNSNFQLKVIFTPF